MRSLLSLILRICFPPKFHENFSRLASLSSIHPFPPKFREFLFPRLTSVASIRPQFSPKIPWDILFLASIHPFFPPNSICFFRLASLASIHWLFSTNPICFFLSSLRSPRFAVSLVLEEKKKHINASVVVYRIAKLLRRNMLIVNDQSSLFQVWRVDDFVWSKSNAFMHPGRYQGH